MGRLSGWRGDDLRARAVALLERLELGPARDLRLRKMSKGMLQRLGLAQALLGEPELLVLDEPMSGLDPQGRKLVRDLILEQRDAGRTVVFSTHILSDVEVVCTRAGILRRGTIDRTLRLDDLGRLGAASVEVHAAGLAPQVAANLKPLARHVVQTGPSWLFTVAPGTPLRELMQGILAAGGDVQSVVPRRTSLEEVFLGAAIHAKPADASTAVAPRTPVGVAS
jgi:ABC-2 type transport system ATP-binding protein